MQWLNSLSQIGERYKGFIVDLWGVVHDGTSLYPGVKDCLQTLRAQNKHIIFLSNAPRRASLAKAVLDGLGIPPTLYDAVITSGELAYEYLAHSPAVPYYFIGPERDAGLTEGLQGYERVADPADAAFLLTAGFERDDQRPEELLPLLEQSVVLDLPMLCINPDLEVVKITGERFLCAGLLAKSYETMNGKVKYFGKPFPEIYTRCMQLLPSLSRQKILAIGDGLYTDIQGAKNFGIDALLVTGGILKEELGIEGDTAGIRPAEEHCRAAGVLPNYIMPALQ